MKPLSQVSELNYFQFSNWFSNQMPGRLINVNYKNNLPNIFISMHFIAHLLQFICSHTHTAFLFSLTSKSDVSLKSGYWQGRGRRDYGYISTSEPGFLVAGKISEEQKRNNLYDSFFFFKEGLRREGEIKLIVILTSHKSRNVRRQSGDKNQYYNSIYHNTMSILRFKC